MAQQRRGGFKRRKKVDYIAANKIEYVVTLRWFLAEVPVTRRGRILPRSETKRLRSSVSLIIQIHSVEELQLVVHLVDHNLHNLHQTSVVTRVHLVIQIQWIFQMTISHSKNGQNELNI